MVNKYLKEAGYLFICGFDGTTMNDHLLSLIKDYGVGGVILFSKNIQNEKQLKNLVSEIKTEAAKAGYKDEILICIDQENGLVNRLEGLGIYFPGAMSLGAADDISLSELIGRATANKLKEFNINFNLAPVLDLNTNPDNPGVGTRSFSDDYELSSRNSDAFIKGHLSEGVMCTAKHFPGLGELSVDTHFKLPEVNKTSSELEELEIIPFMHAIKADVPAIMAAHIRFPKIDSTNYPSSMSRVILTDILRKKMNFDGIIITDCLEMKAISDIYGVEEGAKRALLAGADMVIVSHTPEIQKRAIESIARLVESNEMDNGIIKEKNNRIKKIKRKYTHKKLSTTSYDINFNRIYKNIVTELKGTDKLAIENTIFIVPRDERRAIGEDENEYRVHIFRDRIVNKYEKAIYFEYEDNLLSILKKVDNEYHGREIVIGILDNKFDFMDDRMNNNLHIISLRDPYPNKDLYKESKTWINIYDLNPWSIDVSLECLFDGLKVYGKSPIKLDL